ncbi:MAG: SDR family oxidoreductase [Xanthomonadales bacterium]|nr:SDR family oxidoreductase [Xanthomonadales bacterium]
MSYFVTGATGFIGRFLVGKLLARKGTIYVLARRGSKDKLKALHERYPDQAERIVPVWGDLTKPKLGIKNDQLEELNGKIKHVFHLAAIYDLSASAESQQAANIDGTRNAVLFAEAIKAGCFHHVSSIAAAGLYHGTFREDMFDEAEGLDHPYFRTKHDSEGIVRNECSRPYRIYRPGIVVGHSQTGEIDKIDGPYYFFTLLKRIREAIPAWMPTMGFEGGRINMVPVDFIVDAMDHIAHKRGLDGGCFHLTDPAPRRVGEVLNIFARAGHAPPMTMRIDSRIFAFVPSAVKTALSMLPPVKRITAHVFQSLGIPKDMLKFFNYPTRFDNRQTEAALKGSGIKVPELNDYAWRLWDYWERHLDPDLHVDRSLSGRVKGKTVLITGASSGIGLATAIRVASSGGHVLMVARDPEKLEEARKTVEKHGGKASAYSADLSSLESCDELVAKVIADHGAPDVLVNNAGRSIRRSVSLSYDRFHDFERTMQLNYFGSLRLIMGFLPKMTERRSGHIINISSIGVLSNAPRFSAYVASKAALDAFSRCAAAEFSDANVSFTIINMPLVRTPMIGPTKMYDSVPTLTPEEAAEMVADAIIRRPQRIATRLGVFAEVMHLLAPKLHEVVMNTAYQLFPDSAAAKGQKGGSDAPTSSEQVAFAALMRGIHW